MHRVAPLTLLSLALGALTACGKLDEEKFQAKYIEGICEFYENCTKLYFNEYYDDQAECIEEYEDSYDIDDYDDCDFDADEAKKCLEAIKAITKSCDYDDFDYEDCEDVWDCGDRRRTSSTYTSYNDGSSYYSY